MPHPASRKSNFGRKGPRQVTGKRQVKGTLRPGPVAGPSRNLDEDGGDLDDDDEEVGEDGLVYGYREALVREGKPLSGCKVSVSGCTAIKEDLWAVAVEYGAERHPGLLADTTHLVAETHDSEKYRVSADTRALHGCSLGYTHLGCNAGTGSIAAWYPGLEALVALGGAGCMGQR